MVCADLPPKVVADDLDDEVGALGGVGAVAVGVEGAGGDDVSAFQVQLSVAGGAIVILAVDDSHGLTGGAEVDFEIPVSAAFAKVEAVFVDLAAPLFRRPAAVAMDDDSWVVGEPGLKVLLGSLVGGTNLEGFRRLPIVVNPVEQLLK